MRISFFSFSICDCGYSVGHAVYPDSLVFVFDSLLQSSFHPIRSSSCGSRWRLTALVYKQHLCASLHGAHHLSHFCILGHTSCIYTENILQYAYLIRCERYFARRSLPSRRPIYSGHTADKIHADCPHSALVLGQHVAVADSGRDRRGPARVARPHHRHRRHDMHARRARRARPQRGLSGDGHGASAEL